MRNIIDFEIFNETGYSLKTGNSIPRCYCWQECRLVSDICDRWGYAPFSPSKMTPCHFRIYWNPTTSVRFRLQTDFFAFCCPFFEIDLIQNLQLLSPNLFPRIHLRRHRQLRQLEGSFLN